MNFLGILFLVAAMGCAGNATDTKKADPAVAETTTTDLVNGITDQNKGMKNGPIEVKGTVQNPAFKKLYLWSSYGRTNTLIDSTTVTNGSFSFGTDNYDQGVYMIGIAESNWTTLILNPTETVVELNIKGARMDSGTTAVNSKENQGWFAYQPQETVLMKAIKDARINANKSNIKHEFEKQIVQKEQELLDLQTKMINDYQNTHFAKILTWKQEPNRTDKTKYWDNIDFSDRSLIHGLALSDRIQNFMRAFSRGEEAGFIDCIALVADKAKADEVVLEFALNQMLIGFYESGMENISTYIIDNYINGDACGDADLTNIIKSTAESITKLSVGNTPPNIVAKDVNGKNVDLMARVAKNKYTLVMFWSSWCEHCKGEAPEVLACYNQWASKGFDIYGYSVDTNDQLWKAAVAERQFTFTNVCGYKQWESKGAKDYRITKTPGFFLLDNTGKIVLKPKGIKEVQAFLKANIK